MYVREGPIEREGTDRTDEGPGAAREARIHPHTTQNNKKLITSRSCILLPPTMAMDDLASSLCVLRCGCLS
jgi:hypothetical protein